MHFSKSLAWLKVCTISTGLTPERHRNVCNAVNSVVTSAGDDCPFLSPPPGFWVRVDIEWEGLGPEGVTFPDTDDPIVPSESLVPRNVDEPDGVIVPAPAFASVFLMESNAPELDAEIEPGLFGEEGRVEFEVDGGRVGFLLELFGMATPLVTDVLNAGLDVFNVDLVEADADADIEDGGPILPGVEGLEPPGAGFFFGLITLPSKPVHPSHSPSNCMASHSSCSSGGV